MEKPRRINQEKLTAVLHYSSETGAFVWRHTVSPTARKGSIAGSKNQCGYRQIKIDGTTYSASHLAWLYVYGAWPPDELDHIDRDRGNNRIANLRLASHKQNMENTGLRTNNSSGVTGVSFDRQSGKWKAQIQHFSKKICLGFYQSIDDASVAYTTAKKALCTHYVSSDEVLL